MASAHERTRNNVRMGIFVTAAILLGLVVAYLVSGIGDRILRSTESYTVRFPVEAGVGNLGRGSDVKVGGLSMGSVESVMPAIEDGSLRGIDVGFSLDQSIPLRGNARIFVAGPLIGAEGWLNITSVGTNDVPLPDDRRLTGSVAAGMMANLLGPDNADRFDEIFANVQDLSRFLSTIPDEYDDRIVPILENVNVTTEDARELVAKIRHEDWPYWSARVSHVMDWAVDFTDRIDASTDTFNAALDDGHALISDLRGVVDENRPHLKTSMENVEEVTQRVRDETIDRVHALLDRGQSGLDEAVHVINRVQRDYEIWATDVTDALANANLASQQLKLALIEIRRAPWKVLYRPSPQEIEHELLYDAARSFAMASSDLKSASKSVQRVLEQYGEQIEADPELGQRLRGHLIDSLDRYESAQQRLLDILFME